MELTTSPIFQSAVYRTEAPQYLDLVNKICDPFIVEAKKRTAPQIVSREAKAGKDIGDIGLSYHTENLINDATLYQFRRFIKSTSENILDSQGYDMTNYNLEYTEMWCQEFASKGGGHHDTHIHWNNHISGFYFLKCSDKTSAPMFHDPRAGKMMTQLPEKDKNIVTLATEKVLLKPVPGTMMFFNSFLPHQFIVDNGVEPFRFIHFNLQAIPKNI
tara:strand:- start:614 stop:1261 length:648 start_codon:yes stop_codon:yes gene_type:complete